MKEMRELVDLESYVKVFDMLTRNVREEERYVGQYAMLLDVRRRLV